MTIFEIIDRHSFSKWRQSEKHNLSEGLFFFSEEYNLTTLTNGNSGLPAVVASSRIFTEQKTINAMLQIINIRLKKIVAYYDPILLTHTENWKHCRICFLLQKKKWKLCVWQASLIRRFSSFFGKRNAQFPITKPPHSWRIAAAVEFISILFNTLLFVDFKKYPHTYT